MSKINPPQPANNVQLLPTPPVGFPVVYFPNDSMNCEPAAATCVKELGPGRCMLIVFEPNRVPYYKTGVNWAGDDRRLSNARPFKLAGVWDFLPDVKPRNATRLHKEQLEAQERSQKAMQEKLERERLQREALHEKMKESITQDTN